MRDKLQVMNQEWKSNRARCFKEKSLDELASLAVDANCDGREGAKAEILIRSIEHMNRNSNINTILAWIMIVMTLIILLATLEMAEIIDFKSILELALRRK